MFSYFETIISHLSPIGFSGPCLVSLLQKVQHLSLSWPKNVCDCIPSTAAISPSAWSVISSASSCLFKPTFPVAQKAHWKAHPTWPSQHSWYKAWGTQHWHLGGNTQRTVGMELQWNCLNLNWQHLIWMSKLPDENCLWLLLAVLAKVSPSRHPRSCFVSKRLQQYFLSGITFRNCLASKVTTCHNFAFHGKGKLGSWWIGIWMWLEVLKLPTGVHFPVALLGLVLILLQWVKSHYRYLVLLKTSSIALAVRNYSSRNGSRLVWVTAANCKHAKMCFDKDDSWQTKTIVLVSYVDIASRHCRYRLPQLGFPQTMNAQSAMRTKYAMIQRTGPEPSKVEHPQVAVTFAPWDPTCWCDWSWLKLELSLRSYGFAVPYHFAMDGPGWDTIFG